MYEWVEAAISAVGGFWLMSLCVDAPYVYALAFNAEFVVCDYCDYRCVGVLISIVYKWI